MSLDPLAKGINDGNPRAKDIQEFPSSEFLKEEDNTGSVLENSAVSTDEGNISELEQSEDTQYSNNSHRQLEQFKHLKKELIQPKLEQTIKQRKQSTELDDKPRGAALKRRFRAISQKEK